MLTTNFSLVRRQMEKKIVNVDTGARLARDEMVRTAIQLAKREFRRDKKNGIPKAGGPPVVRSGNLRNGIMGEKFNLGFARYSALVGSTTKYARAVELGGKYSPPSWKGTQAEALGFPYLKPALHKLHALMPEIIQRNIVNI